MSRIGKKPITMPKGVTVTKNGNVIKVKGPKGRLRTFPLNMTIEVKDGEITVIRPDDSKENKSLHGLTRALIQNMITGVSSLIKNT